MNEDERRYLKRRRRSTSRNSCCTWARISRRSREVEFRNFFLKPLSYLKLRQIDAELLEMQVLNRCDQNGNIALQMAAYQDKIKTAFQPPGGVYQSNAEESSGRKSVGKVVMNQTYFKVVVGRVRVSWRLPFYQLEKNICGIFYG
uniref:Uncharacterized protein n=1 Tax=Brassica campestris TaxID=3711 RepID=M4EKX2_BRACM